MLIAAERSVVVVHFPKWTIKILKIDFLGFRNVGNNPLLSKQIFSCVKGKEPIIHVDRWKTHQLNPKTSDETAINW